MLAKNKKGGEVALKAVLTSGWPPVEDETAATGIHRQCLEMGQEEYGAQLGRVLEEFSGQGDGGPITIRGLEGLFRRRMGAFEDLKRFVTALNALAGDFDIVCQIDVFAYAFLKGAKNFDLFLTERRPRDPDFQNHLDDWQREIDRLESFERSGIQIADEERNRYMALRRIITRPSARDERRALAVLLVSGPSTIREISEDLSLPYTLGDRILPTLEQAGIVERRDRDRYSLCHVAIPAVLFCLRETLGMDLLAVLDNGA